MNWAAALAGAGAAFWLSAALAALFQAAPSYQLLKWLFSLGLLNPDVAFAGSFPNPFLSVLGGLLALLGALTLALSLLLFLLARQKVKP